MIKGFNHIGLAVHSIDETMAFMSKAFGAKIVFKQTAPEMGQTSAIVKIGDSYLELMEPCGEGVVKKYLEKHGPGFHHISIKTDNFEEDSKYLEEIGVTVFGKMDIGIGKGGFTLPKTSGGLLYEILQMQEGLYE